MNKREIGSKLKTARKQKSMTQADIAQALGVTVTAVSLWESGRRSMPFELLSRYASIVGIKIEFGGEK